MSYTITSTEQTYVAKVDLTGKEAYFVNLNDDGRLVFATDTSLPILGIVTRGGDASKGCSVMVGRGCVAPLLVGTTKIKSGQGIMTSSDGKATVVSGTKRAVALALETGEPGTLISAMLI